MSTHKNSPKKSNSRENPTEQKTGRNDNLGEENELHLDNESEMHDYIQDEADMLKEVESNNDSEN